MFYKIKKIILESINRFTILIMLIFINHQVFTQPPIIHSFSPTSGPVGTFVTIYGSSFNILPSANIVYFGGVKGTVSASTNNSLTVMVPKGAGSNPITVTNLDNGLTAYAYKPFILKFPGGDNFFNANSFGNPKVYEAYSTPTSMAIGDIDGDGKPDVIVLDYPGGSASSLSILRNTSTYTNISFGPIIHLPYELSANGSSVNLADINGDGKLDIVVLSFGRVSIYKNISIPGNINFSAILRFTTGLGSTSSLEINDLDMDGKSDLALINNGTVCIFRNISTGSNILLDPPVTLIPSSSSDSKQLKIGDIDGDGKCDICVVNFSNKMSILRNLSSSGIISFAPALNYSTGANSYPIALSIADMDGDSVPDINIANSFADQLQFIKNKSKPGMFSFEVLQYYSAQYGPSMIKTEDLNGDGKKDVIYDNPSFFTISIVRNNSTPCNSIFDNKALFDSYYNSDIYVHDLNADGKPEIILPLSNSNSVKFYENKINQTVAGCTTGTTVITTSLSGTSYQWQQNAGSGFANINDNSILSGTNSAILQVTNPSISWNGFYYRCLVDADTGTVFLHSVNTGLVPSISIRNCPGDFCRGDTTLFTAITVNGGNPLFQWQDSNSTFGWKDIPGEILPTLKYTSNFAGTKVRCKMTSSYPCAMPAMAISNAVLINFVCNTTVQLCKNGSTQLASNIYGSFYFWELDTGSGFTNIVDNSNYSGVNNAILQITNIPSSAYGYKYRCKVNNISSNTFTLKFSNTWTGAVSSVWGKSSKLELFSIAR